MRAPPEHFRDGNPAQSNDVFIAVMGVTGSGKSSFISLLTEGKKPTIGNDLTGCTVFVQQYVYQINANRKVYLIDTPGFNDTTKSDAQVLEEVSAWLAASYSKDIKLSGIIYLHCISDRRVGGSTVRIFNLFRQLCGTEPLKKVILATTMWDIIPVNEAEHREEQLKKEKDFWGMMISQGSRLERHYNTRESAEKLIEMLVDGGSVTLDIQDEMVNKKKSMFETAAGQTVQEDFSNERAKLQKDIEGMQLLLEQSDQRTAQDLEELRQTAATKLENMEREHTRIQTSSYLWQQQLQKSYEEFMRNHQEQMKREKEEREARHQEEIRNHQEQISKEREEREARHLEEIVRLTANYQYSPYNYGQQPSYPDYYQEVERRNAYNKELENDYRELSERLRRKDKEIEELRMRKEWEREERERFEREEYERRGIEEQWRTHWAKLELSGVDQERDEGAEQKEAERVDRKRAEREERQRLKREEQKRVERAERAEREDRKRAEQEERERLRRREEQKRVEREDRKRAEREERQRLKREEQKRAEQEDRKRTEREERQRLKREEQKLAEREEQYRADQEKQERAVREQQVREELKTLEIDIEFREKQLKKGWRDEIWRDKEEWDEYKEALESRKRRLQKLRKKRIEEIRRSLAE